MKGKPRPQSDRTRALGIAVLEGAPEASRQTGIPERTIYQWMDSPEYAELRERTKDEVAAEWWAIVQKGFRRVEQLLNSTEDVQKVATATAIITDKMLLIRGEATARSESKDISDDLPASAKRYLRDRFADLAGDPGDGVAPESPQGAEAPAG